MRTKGALERSDPGAFYVKTNAEAEIAAGAARLLLSLAKRGDTAYRIERLLKGLGVVAAVIDDWFAVAIGDADAIRHLLGAYQIAEADFGRLQAECPRDRDRSSAP